MTETTTTWVEGAAGSLFDLDNLPYGVFSLRDREGGGDDPRVGVRIGDHVLDLAPVAQIGDPASALAAAWRTPSLNAFMAMGPEQWAIAREWIVEVLGHDVHEARTAPHVHPLTAVELHLPIDVGDYVDFYASEHHASNVGRIFRPDQEPLLPNWKHLPVGYHGRSGTIVASDTDIVRPCGQRKAPTEDTPTYGPSRRLDIEAELGFVVGTPTRLGERVSTADFAAHTFGVVGLNDWSARDVQAWEYVPLGPFLGKSFATSISHWVTPLAALDAAWTDLPGQDPEPLDYLRVDGPAGLDITVEVVLDGEVVSRPPYAAMYWSPAQMLAHTTVNGATVRTGDLWASGTISGPDADQRGSLLELSWGGKEPFTAGGRERTFLEDGDEVTLRYTAPGTSGRRIALGEVTGRIVPAR
ncbi:fumarylacetoacetase [Nocardioides sp. Soil777]|uniref:fumarylacetoacetase n=1 Tax=Nocardioides sp. Soil777 TaxID=1736409 RepID=UPI000703B479|nr:fumarylacetoacetase [Nocardioides sp. Soil777]KRF01379.1 fumarylacetoacetase [Nocardioides sp. Soil777]